MFSTSGNHRVQVAKLGVVMDGEVCTIDGYAADGYSGLTSTLAPWTIFASNPVRSIELTYYGVWSVTLKEFANRVLYANVVTIQPLNATPILVQMNPVTLVGSQSVINWTFINSAGSPVDLPQAAGAVTSFNIFVVYSESST